MKFDRVIAVKNNKIIFKDGNRAVKTFSGSGKKEEVFSEALNHCKIESAVPQVPKLIEVGCINGKWAISYELAKGKTLAQLMAEAPEEKGRYLELFTDIQCSIHQKSCPSLNKMKEITGENILKSQLDATTRHTLYNELEKMPARARICHGDFEPSNVIIGENGEACIVGWSRATQGEPAADAALTYLLFRLNGDHTAAKEYLNLYCQKSNTDKQEIIKWIAIVAASRSVCEKETARKALLSWSNVVD
ncbi:MAG: phosphotransferase [Clostridia bacterium]|nr:phosphotransferase [Clostridia bacterium]